MQGGRMRGWEAASWEEQLSNGSVKETFFKRINFINFGWGERIFGEEDGIDGKNNGEDETEDEDECGFEDQYGSGSQG